MSQVERGIERACRHHAKGKLSPAVLRAREALQLARSAEGAGMQSIVGRAEGILSRIFLDYLGGEERVLVPCRDVRSSGLALSPSAVFLLSRLEGGLTVEEVLDIAAMPRLEALERLAELLQAGAIRGADRPGGQRSHAG